MDDSSTKFIYIKWMDHSSHATSTWRDYEETVMLKPVECSSIGVIVKEDNDYLIIAQTLTTDGMYLNDMMILKSCILSKKKISICQKKR